MSTQEQDIVRQHDYDGIQEYDNRLPNWWLWLLYGTIIFSVAYWFHFHTIGSGNLPGEKYEKEMAAAAEAQLARMAGQEVDDEMLIVLSQVPESMAEGAETWNTYCHTCHLGGEGKVGPNLTDSYWINGGTPMQILKTITDGVPEKGMIAWGTQLSPAKIQQVAAYVLTMKGKNLPGKAPEGDPE